MTANLRARTTGLRGTSLLNGLEEGGALPAPSRAAAALALKSTCLQERTRSPMSRAASRIGICRSRLCVHASRSDANAASGSRNSTCSYLRPICPLARHSHSSSSATHDIWPPRSAMLTAPSLICGGSVPGGIDFSISRVSSCCKLCVTFCTAAIHRLHPATSEADGALVDGALVDGGLWPLLTSSPPLTLMRLPAAAAAAARGGGRRRRRRLAM